MSPSPRPTPANPPPGAFICYPPTSQVSYQPNISFVDHLRFSDRPDMELVLRDDRLQSIPQPENSRATTNNESLISTWRADSGASNLSALQGPVYHPTSHANLPFGAVTRGGSDFTVHYICWECQRPRSVKYHNEHPVPVGAPLPISSSICHRCQNATNDRITEIFEETDAVTESKGERREPTPIAPQNESKGRKQKSRKK